MTGDLPGTLLLDPTVIEDPYPFYRRLREEAPVWRVPGTDIFVVTSLSWSRRPLGSRTSPRT